MSDKDIEWLEKCKKEPNKYKIYVDNDCISVDDTVEDESVHTFCECGYRFAKELLRYIGCDAEFV